MAVPAMTVLDGLWVGAGVLGFGAVWFWIASSLRSSQ